MNHLMTVEQARSFPWPFTTPRQPMGVLLDRGLIGIPELHQAVQTAYSRRLKLACEIMLSVLAIQQPIAERVIEPAPIDSSAGTPAYPMACPICGGAIQLDHRWDSARHGLGWRCGGRLEHLLSARYLGALQAVYSPEAWVIPPQADYPGLRRRDLTAGPIGYLPSADK
jgi:hypothetical protein